MLAKHTLYRWTISPIIPQFDILSLGSQVFGLFISLSLYYSYSIYSVIPLYAEVKKFRAKKIIVSNNKLTNIKSLLSNKVIVIQSFFKKILSN